MDVYGMVLAGGLSRRMAGTDKALIVVDGLPLVLRAAKRLAPQVSSVLINRNCRDEKLDFAEILVRADVVGEYWGPLAGILTGLEWARERGGDAAWLCSVAVDTPFFPDDLVARLSAGLDLSRDVAAIAASAGRLHPVFGLWSVRLADGLRQALVSGGERRVMAWAQSLPAQIVTWPIEPCDPFTNINTPSELSVVCRRDLP